MLCCHCDLRLCGSDRHSRLEPDHHIEVGRFACPILQANWGGHPQLETVRISNGSIEHSHDLRDLATDFDPAQRTAVEPVSPESVGAECNCLSACFLLRRKSATGPDGPLRG